MLDFLSQAAIIDTAWLSQIPSEVLIAIPQIVLTLDEMLKDDKADYDEIHRHRLERLKKTLEAFQIFEQE